MHKWLCLLLTIIFLPIGIEADPPPQHSPKKAKVETVDAEQALRKLIDGNRRFMTHHAVHPHETVQRRVTLAREGQHPFAIVLSCSDSRVPPEIVFDEGLGDLFVVRIAGNIVDDAVIGSIEYAAEHLGVKLLLVLGHEKCGAVQAAIGNQREAHLRNLVDAIRPAVDTVRRQSREGEAADFADKVVRENVVEVVSLLQSNEPVLKKLVGEKELKVVGGVYHIGSGKVEFLALK